MPLSHEEIARRAKLVKLLVLDVDGVLTDGSLYYSQDDDAMKVFNTQDGLGLNWLQKSGVELAIITGRSSKMVEVRAKSLGIDYLYQGVLNKAKAYEELLQKLHLTHEQVAFAGDDLIDWPILKRAGLSIAVANAHSFVKERVDWVTVRRGGEMAVREICDTIMAANGGLQKMIDHYENL